MTERWVMEEPVTYIKKEDTAQLLVEDGTDDFLDIQFFVWENFFVALNVLLHLVRKLISAFVVWQLNHRNVALV